MNKIISLWLDSIRQRFPSIGPIWLIGSRANNSARPESDWDFIVFGSELLLQCLSDSKDLHRADVDFLVVFDDNNFRAAWGETSKRGALSDWNWKEVGEYRAEYMDSKWIEENNTGVRRSIRQAIRV